ncbi:stereocilin-like [Gigantopelta aegis]|uniref:stereocilin-like n=1 Tax=Gigantopelta aegis TaxID=1735272 RepID=UPI001B88A186|nr:stereocilin-like [Gigantopelta aegis]
MKSLFFCVCLCLLLQTIARRFRGRCPVYSWVDCDNSVEDMCDSNFDCYRGQICCTVGCVRQCVYSEDTTVKPPPTTVKPPATTAKPPATTVKPPATTVKPPATTPGVSKTTPKGVICRKQSDCKRRQCCTSTNPDATIGICENRKWIGYYCHNPRKTGFHHVWCPGPAGIIHPDLCPCGCGDFCAMGPNPRRDAHGGYIGTCSFG